MLPPQNLYNVVSLSRSFNLSYNSLESFGMVHSQIGQNLAVDFNAGLVQSTHQLGIRHTFQTGSSVNTLNPQSAEVSFLILAVTESISQTLFPCILGYGPHILSCTEITSG